MKRTLKKILAPFIFFLAFIPGKPSRSTELEIGNISEREKLNEFTSINADIVHFYNEFYKKIFIFNSSKRITISSKIDKNIDKSIRENLSDRIPEEAIGYTLKYALFDLNGDENSEIITFVQGSGSCSRFGCLTAAFHYRDGKLERIFEANTDGNIYISRENAKEYKTIFLIAGGYSTGKEKASLDISVWQWKGNSYNFEGIYTLGKQIKQ